MSRPSLVLPCDLSRVEDQLERILPATRFLPAILAASDARGDLASGRFLYLRVAFRGQPGPHAVLIDSDDDRETGWWTSGLPVSGSGWDLQVAEDGRLYRHQGGPRDEVWTPVEDATFGRSLHGNAVDLRIPAPLVEGGRVRVAVRVRDHGWTPAAFLPGAAYPTPEDELPEAAAATPGRLAVHLGTSPWRVRGRVSPAEAAQAYGEFAHAVLGASPEDARTADLVQALRARHPGTEVWGRVSAVGTDPRVADAVSAVLDRARTWRGAGATGIALFDAGFRRPGLETCPVDASGAPVALDRTRQARLIAGVHALGLAVLANADSMADLVLPSRGAPVPLEGARTGRAADMVLVMNPSYGRNGPVTGVEREIADAALVLGRRARASSGIRVAALDTAPGPVDDGASRTSVFRDAWRRVTRAGVDAYGFTNASFSADPGLEENLAIVDLPAPG